MSESRLDVGLEIAEEASPVPNDPPCTTSMFLAMMSKLSDIANSQETLITTQAHLTTQQTRLASYQTDISAQLAEISSNQSELSHNCLLYTSPSPRDS